MSEWEPVLKVIFANGHRGDEVQEAYAAVVRLRQREEQLRQALEAIAATSDRKGGRQRWYGVTARRALFHANGTRP